jgi:hypothetical protein
VQNQRAEKSDDAPVTTALKEKGSFGGGGCIHGATQEIIPLFYFIQSD